ncbi:MULTISPECIES: succinate dehydrogenase, cytochrome b556 subunit [Rhizobium/Agrobacterium group]|uniref:Succinate dehydrogenase cytochrome b556 subunit n=2 Tax=Rhizobium/Agrobacterium group TaxID=227290 RepID=B9JTT5_ALLAM|nr:MULTISPECIES: succinate dehydrogenase, cytochrome b556 subunit [Rhizobium/Agrobacterium group]MCF1498117.1 succinate dehydrogenase, cytochrome b556 subunit [Allorhizobium sp. Av2]ACM37993.1 succinate dehydrogenase cytochrome B-556 subunit [Allorhizobium ampelinum S4]KAA3516869.1 succinate dehydrogenase, cytochrome b556 subunit [Agrobacterium vitis]KAA3529634.1 succinate dehydrogenase, cytochrome b556 subunit [Agrobacterium vitis]MBF2717972.1 succinate dehydrogenase, cytochrome b556 subunit 
MANVTKQRPLSPHLQIYKLVPTMLMSIVHRITGGALYFGTALVAWWLIAASTGADYYDWVSWFMGTFIGKIILFGFSWALIHHMLGGMRHFAWDLGYGLEKHFNTKLAKATAVASVVLTVLVWVVAFIIR